jgi:hypothetical protein
MALIFHNLGYQELIKGCERDETEIIGKMQHMREMDKPKKTEPVKVDLSNDLMGKIKELDTYYDRFVLDTENLVQSGNNYLKFRKMLIDYCDIIKPINDFDYLRENRTKIVMLSDDLNKIAPAAEYLFDRAKITLFQSLINELKQLNKLVYINYIVHV